MGSYATITSISNKLPDFLEGNTTTSDSKGKDTFSVYIDKAEAEFNAVAAKRYSLPFSTVPPLAREISFNIAAFYTIRAFSSRDWPNRNEMLDDFAMGGHDLLKKLESGDIKLTATNGSLIDPISTYAQSNRTGEDSVFELDDPGNWRADKNRLDNLDNARN